MKLGIISDSHHYYNQEGELCNLTILTSQFGCWANLFDEVIVCAPLLDGIPPSTHSPYQHSNIHLLPISNAGGNTVNAKFDLLWKIGKWWKTLRKLLLEVDAVHIRCPNNISILGLLALRTTQCLRQAVYTGNWNGYVGEPRTYTLQRWLLKHYFSGPVAVYGQWPNQPSHIIPTFSPSYHQQDWEMEKETVATKVSLLHKNKNLSQPIQILSVGGLNTNKNQRTAIKAVRCLYEQGIHAELHLLGDGPTRFDMERLAHDIEVNDRVYFHGMVPQDTLRTWYRRAHFVVQPSFTEGFSKVPIEAMFHGAIPLLSNLPVNEEIVGHNKRGRTFLPTDATAVAAILYALVCDPQEMIRLIYQGRAYTHTLTIESWQRHIGDMLQRHWKIQIDKKN